MSMHYFTFGLNSILSRRCQPVKADTPDQAKEKMVEMHGGDWGFQYTQAEWEESEKRGFAKEKMLDLVIVEGSGNNEV